MEYQDRYYASFWPFYYEMAQKYFANNYFMQISFMRSCYDSRQEHFP